MFDASNSGPQRSVARMKNRARPLAPPPLPVTPPSSPGATAPRPGGHPSPRRNNPSTISRKPPTPTKAVGVDESLGGIWAILNQTSAAVRCVMCYATCDHSARSLECGHKSCVDCLNKTADFARERRWMPPQDLPHNSYPTSAMSSRNRELTEIECPACHSLTDFCSGADGLELALEAAEERNELKQTCVVCNECEDKVADLYCQQCEVEFCSECAPRVHSSRVMSSHVMITIDARSDAQPDAQLQEPLPAPMCDIHNKEMEFFDLENQIPVCAHCILKEGQRCVAVSHTHMCTSLSLSQGHCA